MAVHKIGCPPRVLSQLFRHHQNERHQARKIIQSSIKEATKWHPTVQVTKCPMEATTEHPSINATSRVERSHCSM
jgi:hypothetical protein